MRRLLLATAVVALLSIAAAAAATRPALSIATSPTVVLRGTSFQARELVRLTLTVDGTAHVIRVRASSRGRFAATFRRLVIDPCTNWRATAKGARGSRAVLVPRVSRDCPPPPPP